MTPDQIAAASAAPTVEQLMKENAALRMALTTNAALRLKVSEKGGVSLYGLNAKFPVTLYGEQWERLFEFVPTMQKFIAANKHKLVTKADKKLADAKRQLQ